MFTRFTTLIAITAIALSLNGCSGDDAQPTPETLPGLSESIISGDITTVRRHIAAGSDIDKKDPLAHGSTPLITATVFDKTEVAVALIEAGADLEAVNNDGSTALHTAAFFCRMDILKALLAKGADREARNNTGSTAYESVAVPYETVEPIYQLLDKMLGPMGVKIDFDYIRATRPRIAELLKK